MIAGQGLLKMLGVDDGIVLGLRELLQPTCHAESSGRYLRPAEGLKDADNMWHVGVRSEQATRRFLQP